MASSTGGIHWWHPPQIEWACRFTGIPMTGTFCMQKTNTCTVPFERQTEVAKKERRQKSGQESALERNEISALVGGPA